MKMIEICTHFICSYMTRVFDVLGTQDDDEPTGGLAKVLRPGQRTLARPRATPPAP